MRNTSIVKKAFYSNSFLKRIWIFSGNIFFHITAPTGAFRSFVLFPIMGFCRVHKLFGMHKPYDNIELLKDKYVGKRCFVVATGPSLQMDDLRKLDNEVTFSMNSMFKCYKNTEWRPTFYLFGDFVGLRNVLEKNEIHVDLLAKEYALFSAQCRRLIGKSQKLIYININWLDHWYNSNSNIFKYNDNLLYGFYDYYTITNSCIQLAMYMGMKEIYLLGVDCDYSRIQKHVYESEEIKQDEVQCESAGKAMLNGYNAIKKVAEKNGVKIFNATRGGKLEVFDRVEFDTLF